MKKILNSITFVSRVFFLLLLLIAGWVFINVQNLVKGKKVQKTPTSSSDLFGVDMVEADVPHIDIGGGY